MFHGPIHPNGTPNSALDLHMKYLVLLFNQILLWFFLSCLDHIKVPDYLRVSIVKPLISALIQAPHINPQVNKTKQTVGYHL